MWSTAWYFSFLSVSSSHMQLLLLRMTGEILCPRRTSAPGSPLLAVPGPAASDKNDWLLWITCQSWAWGDGPFPLPSFVGPRRRKLPKARPSLGLAASLGVSSWGHDRPSHHLWLHFVTCTGVDSQEVLQK